MEKSILLQNCHYLVPQKNCQSSSFTSIGLTGSLLDVYLQVGSQNHLRLIYWWFDWWAHKIIILIYGGLLAVLLVVSKELVNTGIA